MPAGEARSSRAAQSGAEIGLPFPPPPCFGSLGYWLFCSWDCSQEAWQPCIPATPPLRHLVGTAHALRAFPARQAAALPGFPAMPSAAPWPVCYPSDCPMAAWGGRDRLGWGHKAKGSMGPFVPAAGVSLRLERQRGMSASKRVLRGGRQSLCFPAAPLWVSSELSSHREKERRRRWPGWQPPPASAGF